MASEETTKQVVEVENVGSTSSNQGEQHSSTKISSEDKMYIILAHILGIFFSFIPPLIILLKTENTLVKKHARNALNFQITLLIYWVAGTFLSLLTLGLGLIIIFPVILAYGFIFPIIATIKAKENPDIMYKYPLSINIIKDE